MCMYLNFSCNCLSTLRNLPFGKKKPSVKRHSGIVRTGVENSSVGVILQDQETLNTFDQKSNWEEGLENNVWYITERIIAMGFPLKRKKKGIFAEITSADYIKTCVANNPKIIF